MWKLLKSCLFLRLFLLVCFVFASTNALWSELYGGPQFKFYASLTQNLRILQSQAGVYGQTVSGINLGGFAYTQSDPAGWRFGVEANMLIGIKAVGTSAETTAWGAFGNVTIETAPISSKFPMVRLGILAGPHFVMMSVVKSSVSTALSEIGYQFEPRLIFEIPFSKSFHLRMTGGYCLPYLVSQTNTTTLQPYESMLVSSGVVGLEINFGDF